MRRKSGIICILLGLAMMLAGAGLYLYNQNEDHQAKVSAQTVLPELTQQILQTRQDLTLSGEIPEPAVPEELLAPEDLTMTEVLIDGYPYIGYLQIPDLGLELPVLGDWNYQWLQKAPCRYTGTVKGRDLVVMAHNYSSHFGRLDQLTEGADVIFTDMDGMVWEYQIVLKDVLGPFDTEEMTAGEYDLTLFTCTPGGSHRVTVRCDLKQ